MAISGHSSQDYLTQSTTSIVKPASFSGFSSKALDLMQRRQVSDEDIQTFQAILAKTENKDAKKALKDLSADEMEVLRKVHSLGETIQVSGLTEEGAANLLAEPGSARDLNNDGLWTIGVGNMFAFPPDNAPESFKKAWAEASEGAQGLLDVPTHMIFAVGLANIGREPGDPDWVNPYASPDFDYGAEVSSIMESLEYQYKHSMIAFEQYQKHMQFYNKLQDAMTA